MPGKKVKSISKEEKARALIGYKGVVVCNYIDNNGTRHLPYPRSIKGGVGDVFLPHGIEIIEDDKSKGDYISFGFDIEKLEDLQTLSFQAIVEITDFRGKVLYEREKEFRKYWQWLKKQYK